MSIPKSKPEEWVELKFFVPRSWRDELDRIATKRGYRKVAELLRDLVREVIEKEVGP